MGKKKKKKASPPKPKEDKKCSFKHCLYGGVIVDGEDYVTLNGKHYHPDCNHIRSGFMYIIDLWHKRIDKDVHYGYLQKTLNDLVLNKGYSIDYVTYAIEYVLNHNMRLNYPDGIKYYLVNPQVKQAYAKKIVKNQTASLEESIKHNVETPKETVNYKKRKTSLLQELFGDEL